MKWLWAAFGGVALVLAWQGMSPLFNGSDTAEKKAGVSAPTPELATDTPSTNTLEGAEWGEPQKAQVPDPTPLPEPDAPVAASENGVINIGEPMDPSDPSTWPELSGVVSQTGDPHMNPADPSTWTTLTGEVDESGDPFMDPNDPLTWPVPEGGIQDSEEPYRDPNDPFTWQPPPERHSDAANEDRNPYDPSTWD